MKRRIVCLTLMVFLLGVAAAEAVVLVQCPCTPNPTIDNTGLVNAEGNIECKYPNPITGPRNIVCKTLAAGDGFIRMADGDPGFPETYTPLYTFGFSDMTGQPSGDILSNSLLKANFAAPVISIKEGQEFYLTLCNVGLIARADLFDPHSVHFHGFPNAAPFFDGEPMGSLAPVVGACFTFYYNLVDPGTYMYHCHVEATEHMQMGMLGNLYLRPIQDDNAPLKNLGTSRTPPSATTAYQGFAYNDGDGSTGYDVAYPIQIHGMDPDFHDASIGIQPLNFANLSLPNADKYPMLNGRGYPDTIVPGELDEPIVDGSPTGYKSQKTSSLIVATVGQKILLRISNLSSHFRTLRVLGIPMKVVGKDSKLLRGPTSLNLSYNTNSLTLGGGQSADVILDTTTNIAGTYFLYTTNLNHLSNNQQERGGMMTTIVLSP